MICPLATSGLLNHFFQADAQKVNATGAGVFVTFPPLLAHVDDLDFGQGQAGNALGKGVKVVVFAGGRRGNFGFRISDFGFGRSLMVSRGLESAQSRAGLR